MRLITAANAGCRLLPAADPAHVQRPLLVRDYERAGIEDVGLITERKVGSGGVGAGGGE